MHPMPVITTSAARLFVSSSPPPAGRGGFHHPAFESAGRSAKAVHFSTKVAVLPPPPLSPRELHPALPPRPPLHPLHPSRCRSFPSRSSLPPASPPPADDSRAPSPLSELSEDNSSSGSASSSIIEKPSGEAGRPGRGGYNLQAKMKWDKDIFRAFQVCSVSIARLCFQAHYYIVC